MPDCWGRAKPGGRRRRRRPAARVSSPVAPGEQDSFLSFASVLPSLRIREQQILFLDWLEKGACLHGQTHSLHAFAEQSCEGPAGSGRRVERRWGAGEGRRGVGRLGPVLLKTAGGGEVPGGCSFWPSRVCFSLSLSLFYCSCSISPEVNSTMKASSSPVNGSCERLTAPRRSRRRRRRYLVVPQL